ncbi:MAG: hypothetical protein EOP19_04455, partial [Hyphomicrobiales bacterium]
MADYKELLRRAVDALPENNGAARRAVYEKARAALVGQLRAINPPLAARDITTHRLQLEDCIRQVEQESSEAVIAGMSGVAHESVPAPVYFEPVPNKQLPPPGRGPAKPQLNAAAHEAPAQASRSQQPGASIEDIIAAADRDSRDPAPRNGAAGVESRTLTKPIQLRSVPAEPAAESDEFDEVEPPKAAPTARPGGRPLPAIVARAEAAKHRTASTAFSVPGGEKPYDGGRRGPTLEARREGTGGIGSLGPQLGTARSPQLVTRQQAEPIYLEAPQAQITAMSAVREVEVEPDPHPADPQGLIDRAMATLDREARGETTPAVQNGFAHNDTANDTVDDGDERPARVNAGGMFPDAPRRGEAPGKPGRNAKPAREAKPKREEREERDDRATKGRRGREAGRETAFAEAGFPRARAEDERGG